MAQTWRSFKPLQSRSPGSWQPELLLEIFENESWSRNSGWCPSAGDCPLWCHVSGAASLPPEDIQPPQGYEWSSKGWQVDRGNERRRHCDRQGWEYASTVERFKADRQPRGEARWRDRARRRRWVRPARRKVVAAAPSTTTSQIQEGLEALVKGRRILRSMTAIIGSPMQDSPELRQRIAETVQLLRGHSDKIEALLLTAEEGRQLGVRKLRSDWAREHAMLVEQGQEVERKSSLVPVQLLRAEMEQGDGDEGDGIYVSRTVQSNHFLKQMQFQDEEQVMEAVVKEREELVMEVTRGVVQLKEIFGDFATLVQQQQEGIDTVVQQTSAAAANARLGHDQIVQAAELQQQSCVIS